MELIYKTCGTCKRQLLIDMFGLHSQAKDGRRSRCRDCRRVESKEYGKNYSEKIKEGQRAYRLKNRIKVNEYEKERRRKNPESIRDSRLRHKYGISIETYDKLLAYQDFGCAICGRSEPNCTKSIHGHLYVDHDHNTGKVRGLLCHPCNWAIGFVECEKMEKALIYLKEPVFDKFLNEAATVEIGTSC